MSYETNPFRDFGTRIELAKIGAFSVDQPAHRLKRARQAEYEAKRDAAYAHLKIDRDRTLGRVLAKLEGRRTDGIWARSTREWTAARDAFDRAVMEFADV